MDKAFAPPAHVCRAMRLATKPKERAGRIAINAQNRMSDEPQRKSEFGNLGERGIEQERHVVVNSLDDGDFVAARGTNLDVSQRDQRLAARARS